MSFSGEKCVIHENLTSLEYIKNDFLRNQKSEKKKKCARNKFWNLYNTAIFHLAGSMNFLLCKSKTPLHKNYVREACKGVPLKPPNNLSIGTIYG